MAASGQDRDREDEPDVDLPGLAATAVTFLTLVVAFGLLGLGVEAFWVAFPIGFGGLLPLSVVLTKWYESRTERSRDRATESTETDDALAALRERYARGELNEAEFEARVERLLETESIDDADTLLGTGETGDPDTSGDTPEDLERTR